MPPTRQEHAALAGFHAPTRTWFARAFASPTLAQTRAWPALATGQSTLLLAPTGSGKTLAAFLHAIDRLMFALPEATTQQEARDRRCRVLYVSPLKALAVDVERNLRAPIAGIREVAATEGVSHHVPEIALRTGDTPARERAQFGRRSADILITTPESLYLLLTSNARERLRGLETVILDEIHALVPTKRGAHLALSLERLQALNERPLTRIGLSATQRPLDEVARFLGGLAQAPHARDVATSLVAEATDTQRSESASLYRPVTIVDAGATKTLELLIEVPVEDMAVLGKPEDDPKGPAPEDPARTSIWAAIHPRLLELVRAHTSTLIFVNSRRIAERLAASLNELAGEVLAYAHHGSVAPDQRAEIEERLKAGHVRALVATSSLELGIDMGAIDLVVQIEAPPSVASGLQRIGRAGHQVGAPSRGVIFPKYRGDLLASAAVAHAMREADVEAIRYPRNPLDVLAQQIVAMVAMDTLRVEEVFDAVRRAAPYATLSRTAFDALLEMLAGQQVSDDFAELRPRVVWDRAAGTVTARDGARRIAVTSGGTIPDRGLFGVYLAGGASGRGGARVGELDEEMVFEIRVGETFLLGASTWRIEEITHDRVLVSPAPGEPGKMPFWHGESADRSVALGRLIGALTRELLAQPRSTARKTLVARYGLDERAAANLLAYFADQRAATNVVPEDQHLLIERVRDELGDWRVCVLSPLGGRVHAPWAMAVTAKIREETGLDVETMWTDDGFVVRFPESDTPPDSARLLPDADEMEELVRRELGGTALFAARFREAAARALLLPRRFPGRRAPLWQTRKRAADLLASAGRQPSFPILLEAYRESLRDVFDLPALGGLLRGVSRGEVKVTTVTSTKPSPYAANLLFSYVANYIYDGDAPLAERRAQALTVDEGLLRELLGEGELRELLDPDCVSATEEELQQLPERLRARSLDGIHDLLLRHGDLSPEEIGRRCVSAELAAGVTTLLAQHRAVLLTIAGQDRYVAAEHASRYRDALGLTLPAELPEAFRRAPADPVGELLLRYARTHGPFAAKAPATRLGLAVAAVTAALHRLAGAAESRLVEGAFLRGQHEREWCDPEVLRSIRRRSLARLRQEIEPVEPAILARFLTRWHQVVPSERRRGPDAVLDAVEKLQGVAIAASTLERELLPARVDDYLPGDLDALAAAGELVWVGAAPLGAHDGWVKLYLADAVAELHRPVDLASLALEPHEQAIVGFLQREGASFFASLHEGVGGGFPQKTVDALWSLVWKGVCTNDTFRTLRAWVRSGGAGVASAASRGRGRDLDRWRGRGRGPGLGLPSGLAGGSDRAHRFAPASAEGRWSLVASSRASTRVALAPPGTNDTVHAAALARQLLARYGVVTREVGAVEELVGGFSAVYEVLRTLEETGKIRRGYFVSGVAAMQFALPAVLDTLRGLRRPTEAPEVVTLLAVDPANPYGALLPWPDPTDDGATRPSRRALSRAVGSHVVLVDGALAGWVARGGRTAFTFLPADEPERTRVASALSAALAQLAGAGVQRELLLVELDDRPAGQHPLAPFLRDKGFISTYGGMQFRPVRLPSTTEASTPDPEA